MVDALIRGQTDMQAVQAWAETTAPDRAEADRRAVRRGAAWRRTELLRGHAAAAGAAVQARRR